MTKPNKIGRTSPMAQELLDAGKRASEMVNLYVTNMDWDDIKDKFVAIRLEDGSSDGIIYDSKIDAIKHQNFEQQCAYVGFRNLMGGSTPRDMAIFIAMNREAYDHGMRLADPEAPGGGPNLAPTAAATDYTKRLFIPTITEEDIAEFKKSLGLI